MENTTLIPNTGNSEIVIYQPDDIIRLEVRMHEETLWLTQQQMAVLFGCSSDNIGLHLKNLFSEQEINRDSTTEFFSVVRLEGNRTVRRNVMHYNLDAILSVGYRVSSRNATLFRQWANRVLKNYLMKGYAVNRRFERLEYRMTEAENKIDFFVRTALPPVEGIFFDGQIFDAYSFVSDLVRSAKRRIVLFDNYVDDTVLTMLDKRGKNVSANIYTKAVSSQLALDLAKHNAQYRPIEIKTFDKVHDRFLCIDSTLYHIGASLKDLGKKWCAFNRMEMTAEELVGNVSS